MKVLSIIGTRPEAIKMAPVIKALQNANGRVESVVCVTAQHRKMLDQVMRLFDIAPDIDLDLMRPNQDLHLLTGKVFVEVGKVLEEIRPDVVLVQGDTTTVMAASIAAYYHKIPVGHVEAGLRTSTLYSPFPEEGNRRLTSVVTTFHFAPTILAKKALLREGVEEEKIFVTGNTVIDALFFILKQPVPEQAGTLLDLARINGNPVQRRLVLVTAHRRENFGDRLKSICQGLRMLVERNPDVVLIYPVHLNPNVYDTVHRMLDGIERIMLTDPVEYDVLTHLMRAAHLVLTDSGGIQEEAPSLGKPVLVMRTETERPEGIQAGTAKLVGPDGGRILAETEKLLQDAGEYNKMARAINPYGDGNTAKRIVDVLINQL
jgi:UDP-N-acetylglucosamine 2-epimerase (non-hydrolysing)